MTRSPLAWNRWTVIWFAQLIPLAPLVAYVVLRLVLGPRLGTVTGTIGLVTIAYSLLVVLLGATGRGPRWLGAHRLQLALAIFAALFTYILCEVALSGLHAAGLFARRDTTFWVYENSQNTLHFDPIRGYRLTQAPARFARLTNGEVEYVGTLKGNDQGFPDRDDFAPARPAGNALRLAVFGDSCSAAQFLQQNWPDAVEDLTRNDARPIQLLNFSIDGGGLANWWSVLTKIVKPQEYDLDGVIFAVYPSDLFRKFSMAEHDGYERHMFGRFPTWDASKFPTTREEATPYLQSLDGYIVDSSQFEEALAGRWMPEQRFSPLRALYVTSRAYDHFRNALGRVKLNELGNELPEGDVLGREQLALIADMRRTLESMGLPVLVVAVPQRYALLREGEQVRMKPDTQEFASLLGAELRDGNEAFKNLTPDEIRALWLPHEHHWAQGGSDRFARYMVEVLAHWPPADKPDEKP